MAIEPVKIPQNVYVEDTIIGPVTLKQLGIVGIGAAISYIIYSMVISAGYSETPIQIICWSPAMIAAAFAFFKVNDLSLFTIILLEIESMNKPKIRTWSPHKGLCINIMTSQTMQQISTMEKKSLETQEKLVEMTKQLEKKQRDIDEIASFGISQTTTAIEPVVTKMKDIIAPSDAPQMQHSRELNALPVTPERIQAGGLDPARSIDTISRDLQRIHRPSPLRFS